MDRRRSGIEEDSGRHIYSMPSHTADVVMATHTT